MDHEDLMEWCHVKMCRICFVTDSKMYSMTSSKVLNEAYETLTGILTGSEQRLPRLVCAECADRLMNCARFRRRSLRARSLLLQVAGRHGRITVELVHSIVMNQNPFSRDSLSNPNDDRCSFDDQELGEVSKLTEEQCDIRPKDGMYENIYTEHKTNDVAVTDIKLEDDDLNNQKELNTNLDEGIVGHDFAADDNDVMQNIEDITLENDMISRDDISVHSIGLKKESDAESIENNVNINQGVVKDEVISDNSLVYPAALYEGSNVLEGVHSYVLNENNLKVDVKSPSDDTDRRESFVFDGEDVLCDCVPSQAVKQEAKRVTETSQEPNELKIDDQQPPEADGPTDDSFRCDICPYQTDVGIQLMAHLKAHAAISNVFHCDVRDLETNRKKIFSFHMRKQFGGVVYTCDVCKEMFKLKSSLKLHMQFHCGEKYLCDVCNKAYDKKSNLLQHLSTHSGVKPYTCNVCNKAFGWRAALWLHLKTHSNERPHSCDVCNKAFDKKSILQQHLSIHSGVKPYTCDVCKKAFRTSSLLWSHLKTHSNEKPYSCEVCNKAFKVKHNLQTHLSVHSGAKPYSCAVCEKAFRFKKQLITHLSLHSGVKPYTCDVCNKAFGGPDGLRLHLKTHSKERPHSCDVCNKAFKFKQHLQRHLYVHSDSKPYSCDVCNKAFKQKIDLQTHLKKHSDAKPYSCAVCEKAFRFKKQLITHLNLHSGVKPYTCNVCRKTFGLRDGLRSHLKTHSIEKP